MSAFPSPSNFGRAPWGPGNEFEQAISKICGYPDVIGVEETQRATLLAMAHLSGWSAELITIKIDELFGSMISAEKAWDAYKSWDESGFEHRRNGLIWEKNFRTTEDMFRILRQYDIKPNFFARPLSQTPRPISVPFSNIWIPDDENSVLLCNFTEQTRVACFNAMSWRGEKTHLAVPVREELRVMERLGSHVTNIIKQQLLRWTNEQTEANEQLPFTRAIEVSIDNIETVEKYVECFKQEWEELFGRILSSDKTWLPQHGQLPVYRHLSTGDATVTFFRILLITRLQAMEKRRLAWRDIVGFREIPLSRLPKDLKDCHICQQPLGIYDEDGEMEMPIQVIACCGNYFGGKCLRRWYGEFKKKECPLCKWTASATFLDQLRDEGMADEYDEDNFDRVLSLENAYSYNMIEISDDDDDDNNDDDEDDDDELGDREGDLNQHNL